MVNTRQNRRFHKPQHKEGVRKQPYLKIPAGVDIAQCVFPGQNFKGVRVLGHYQVPGRIKTVLENVFPQEVETGPKTDFPSLKYICLFAAWSLFARQK